MGSPGYNPDGVVRYVERVFAEYHGMPVRKAARYFRSTGLDGYVRAWWESFAYESYWGMMQWTHNWLQRNGIEPPPLLYDREIDIRTSRIANILRLRN